MGNDIELQVLPVYILLLIYILFVHFLADFVYQTDFLAKNKSKSFSVLTLHVLEYMGVMAFFMFILLLSPNKNSVILNDGIVSINLNSIYLFTVFNGFSHWLIDAVTSRITSKLFNQGKIHYGFVVVGIDQFLHTALLICSSYSLFVK